MLTVPTALWPLLLSQKLKTIEVYEIAAFGGRSALYYAGQDVTWGGHSYSGLAISRDPIKYTKDAQSPSCSVIFSNVANTLRSYLYPTDTLTGARLTVRLLMRDGAGTLSTDSLILFVGEIRAPQRITETEFKIEATGLLNAKGAQIPGTTFGLTCPLQFANGGLFDGNGDCAYQSNTTASSSQTNSVNLTVASASTFQNGDSIQIGGGAAVTIASGGGSASLTLAEPRTWLSGDAVRYADCPHRTRPECEARGQLYRFGGFPATAVTSRIKVKLTEAGKKLLGAIAQAGEIFADPTIAVPLLTGRRKIRPKCIEITRAVVRSKVYSTAYFAMSRGEIDSIVRYFVDQKLGVDKVVSSDKRFGIYYRAGVLGINDTETQTEYDASPSTQLRSQNIDVWSVAGVAYSKLAYVTLRKMDDLSQFIATLPDFEVDVKGVKCQVFTTAGAHDGSAAWSPSPIWQAVWAGLEGRYGLGLAESDFDFAVIRPEADYAAAVIDSSEASTTVKTGHTSSTNCEVNSSEGFIAGKAVYVNGVSNTVADVVDDTHITLGTAVTTVAGQTVIQKTQRFESHLYLESAGAGTGLIKTLMDACRGYVTYDAGKIQFRVERDHCKERETDGGFEIWTDATHLTNWTLNDGTGQETANRDGTTFHGGTYAVRLDRTGSSNYAGIQQTITGLEPGRWYRVEYWHKQDAGGIGDANRCILNNDTQGLGCGTDGVTWSASASLIIGPGSTSWTKYEATFKIREDFGAGDSYTLRFPPYFTSGHSVWFDDCVFRGPYAGDFREMTTALLMGWAEGSFVWSLDRWDRETNRFIVGFRNESGYFGDDRAVVDDFDHQLTHPTSAFQLDCKAIDSRDQAHRIATFLRDKKRVLGPGCEFVGTPAALPLQPGDVILVSHSVPGWTCEEQRVRDVEILGRSGDEHFVTIRTEDYQEAIYSDAGAPANIFPPRASASVSVTLLRNTGGVLELFLSLTADGYAAHSFQVYRSDSSGFTPDATTLIGSTQSAFFVYIARDGEFDVAGYVVVVAVTDRGTIQSSETGVTIYRTDRDSTDPTQNENSAPINLVSGGDFNDPTKWDVEGAGSGYSNNFQFPSTRVSPYDASTSALSGAVGDVTDNSDSTLNAGTATSTGGTPNGDDDSALYHSFGAGTGKTGRPYVRVSETKQGALGNFLLFYTLDRTVGSPTWVQWLSVGPLASPTDYYGSELTGIDYTKFGLRALVKMNSGGIINQSITGNIYRLAFDEKGSTGTSYGQVSANLAEIQGDGTNYGGVSRAFPGDTPSGSPTIFKSGMSAMCLVYFRKKNSGDTPDSNPIEVSIKDTVSGTAWNILSVPSAQIDASGNWRAAAVMFQPSSDVSGSLILRVRTKNTKPLQVDKVMVCFGDRIFKWVPSVTEQAAGYFADYSNGQVTGFGKGAWTVDTPKYSEVA